MMKATMDPASATKAPTICIGRWMWNQRLSLAGLRKRAMKMPRGRRRALVLETGSEGSRLEGERKGGEEEQKEEERREGGRRDQAPSMRKP